MSPVRSTLPAAAAIATVTAATIATIAALASSCASPLSAGEHGDFRFVGVVRGDFPLRILPPISDREGNLYTLYGSLDLPEATAFVSRAHGGSSLLCSITKGDTFGPHGWVGFAESNAWYWSGGALVFVGGDGSCGQILDRDPGTDSSLSFRAVLPWVRDAPSRSTVVALVQSPLDASPFTVLIDLNAQIFTSITAFTPEDATDVRVIGVGADRAARSGVVLLAYRLGEDDRLEARFYDEDAALVAIAPIRGGPLSEYGVAGYLQINAHGTVAGLVPGVNGAAPSLVSFDRFGGAVTPLTADMAAVGVHRWEGRLWLVGTAEDEPVLAPIDDKGNTGTPVRWDASVRTAAGLAGPLSLIDDRSAPSRRTTWASVRPATGVFPFLHAHSSTEHAEGTTITVIGGPQFESGGSKRTSFAVVPIGISYP
jgi:hypothetical protein